MPPIADTKVEMEEKHNKVKLKTNTNEYIPDHATTNGTPCRILPCFVQILYKFLSMSLSTTKPAYFVTSGQSWEATTCNQNDISEK